MLKLESAAAEIAAPLAGIHVLLLVQDALSCVGCTILLEDFGCVVASCAAPAEAFDSMGWNRPHVALIDIDGHSAGAYRVADALDRIGVPVVLQTALAPALLEQTRRHYPVLAKPAGPNHLQSVLMRALR